METQSRHWPTAGRAVIDVIGVVVAMVAVVSVVAVVAAVVVVAVSESCGVLGS